MRSSPPATASWARTSKSGSSATTSRSSRRAVSDSELTAMCNKIAYSKVFADASILPLGGELMSIQAAAVSSMS